MHQTNLLSDGGVSLDSEVNHRIIPYLIKRPYTPPTLYKKTTSSI